MKATKVLAIVTVCVFLVTLGVSSFSAASGTNDSAEMVPALDRAGSEPIIIDHTCTDLNKIPDYWIEQAKDLLKLSYGHTSHGSQPITGMGVLESGPLNVGG